VVVGDGGEVVVGLKGGKEEEEEEKGKRVS
jgi:hypothetical protein